MKVDHDRQKELLYNMIKQSSKQDTLILQRGQLINELTSQKEDYVKIVSNNVLLEKSLQSDLDSANAENKKLKTRLIIAKFLVIGEAIGIVIIKVL